MRLSKIITAIFCVYSCWASAQTKLPVSTKKEIAFFDSLKVSVSNRFFNNPEGTKKDALLLLKLAKSKKQRVEALHLLGYVYDLTGKVDSAKYCLETRLQLTTQFFWNTSSHYQAVIDYTNWGMDYLDGTVLVDLLTKTMASVNESKNSKELGLMYMLLGDVFLRDKALDKANYYYEKSFKRLHSKLAKVDYYERKGNWCIAKNNFKEAKIYFEKAITLLDNKTVFVHVGYLRILGYLHYRLQNFTLARQYLEESLQLQRKFNYSNLHAATFLNLAYLEKEAHHLTTEKQYLDSAKTHYDGDLLLWKDIALAYTDYYSRSNDFVQEKRYLDLYTQAMDSINNAERIKTKLRLESAYQLKENQKELFLKEKILEKETTLKSFYLISSIVLFVLTLLIFWIFYTKYRTQKKLNQNQYFLHDQTLKLMQENQRTEIIKEKIKAKLEERGKLSLELHDGIANEIGALKWRMAEKKEFSKEAIDSIVTKMDCLYHEVRNLSHDLDPENIADVEFSQLVHNLCDSVEKSGMQVHRNLFISKKIDALPESNLLHLYRILQEAIQNTIKHAQATLLEIEILETESELLLRIKDNGKGFSVSASKPGIGMKNMQKRVQALQGIFKINQSNLGTMVSITIPLSS